MLHDNAARRQELFEAEVVQFVKEALAIMRRVGAHHTVRELACADNRVHKGVLSLIKRDCKGRQGFVKAASKCCVFTSP